MATISALDVIPVAALVAGGDARVRGANRAWCQLAGISEQQSLGWGWTQVLGSVDRRRLSHLIRDLAASGGVASADNLLAATGRERWTRWALAARDVEGERVVAMTVVDIDADRTRMEVLRHQATVDSLTGLVNRAELLRLTTQALDSCDRVVGVVYVDLDGFKKVNDHNGHLVGDRVLAAVARRLAAGVRPGDVLARLGGDEFAVLCPNLDRPEQVENIAARVRDALSTPVRSDARTWMVGVTVGTAVARAGQTAEELLAAADASMYWAKRAASTRRQHAGVGGRSLGTTVRAPGPTADNEDLIERANLVIQQIFAVGLDLASCQTMVHGPAADRIASAIEALDTVIARVRQDTFTRVSKRYHCRSDEDGGGVRFLWDRPSVGRATEPHQQTRQPAAPGRREGA
jgi:diguanylate cyclase (GGDEF)-like protein/PAS domain S-box-containing protein